MNFCTADDHCDSCPDAEDCHLKKAIAWRAAREAEGGDDEDDNDDDDDDDDDDNSPAVNNAA